MARGGSSSAASTGIGGRAGGAVSRGGFGSIEGGRGGRPSAFSSRELSRFNNTGNRPNLRVIENKNFSINRKTVDVKPGFKPYLAVNNENPVKNMAGINNAAEPVKGANDNFQVNINRFVKFSERQAANDNFPSATARFIKYTERAAVNDNEKFKAVIEPKRPVKPESVIKLKEPVSVFEKSDNRSSRPNQRPVISEIRYSQELARIMSRAPVIDSESKKVNSIIQTERREAVKSAVEILGKGSVQAEKIRKEIPSSPRLIKEEVKTGLRIAQLQQEIRKIVNEQDISSKPVNPLAQKPEQGRILAVRAEAAAYLDSKKTEIKTGKIEPLTIKPTAVRIQEIQQELKAMAQKEQLKLKIADAQASGLAQTDRPDKKKEQYEKDKKDRKKFYVIDQTAKKVRAEMAREAIKKMRELAERRAYGSGIKDQAIVLPVSAPKEALSGISNGRDGSYSGFRAEIESIDSKKHTAAGQIIDAANDNNNPVDESDRNVNPATRQEIKKVLNG